MRISFNIRIQHINPPTFALVNEDDEHLIVILPNFLLLNNLPF